MKERIHAYDICRIESWEKQQQRLYLENDRMLPNRKEIDLVKLDKCLSK